MTLDQKRNYPNTLVMNAFEIKKLVEDTLAVLPERISGNEESRIVAKRLVRHIDSSRDGIVEYLRGLLSFRIRGRERVREDVFHEAGIWMALHLAEEFSLQELRPDIEDLIRDVRGGAVLRPIDEKSVSHRLSKIT